MPFEPTATVTSKPPRRKAALVLRRLIIYPILFYSLWCAGLYFYQDYLIYPRDLAPQPPPKSTGYGKSTVITSLDVGDNCKVQSWFVPAADASAEHPAPLAVFFHGNAEIIDFEDEIVGPYHDLGVSVLLPEYRGYGRCAGKPSQSAIVDDCLKLYEEALKRPDVDKHRVVFHGRSLGGGIAVQVAARNKPSALVLQSTFISMAAMANKYAAPGFLVRDGYRTDLILPNLNLPLLVAHGTRDQLVPMEQARTLQQMSPGAVLVTYDCDHNGFPGDENMTAYWNQIAEFLRKGGVLSK